MFSPSMGFGSRGEFTAGTTRNPRAWSGKGSAVPGQRGPRGGGLLVDAAFLEEVRQSTIRNVDSEVGERLQAAWQRGARAAHRMQKESEQSFSSLTQTVSEIHVAQRSLEVENERLRHVMAELAGHLSHIGGAFEGRWGAAAGCATPSTACSSADALTPRAQEPALFFPSGGEGTPGGDGAGSQALWHAAGAHGEAPLPAAKVSLADVLGITSSEEESASSMPDSPSSLASQEEDIDAFVFMLTLRLADGADLGLTTSQSGRDRHLRIERVLPGGAADAWNRQCSTSGGAERLLRPGDRIVGVNGAAGDPQAMLAEFSSRRLLRFQIVRTGRQAPSASPPAAPLPGAAKLRLDAALFLPTSRPSPVEVHSGQAPTGARAGAARAETAAGRAQAVYRV